MSRVAQIDGLRVVDSKKTLVLHITNKDIKGGKLKSPAGCAAAIACLRQLKATEARVHVSRTYVRHNGKWERYLTPQSLRSEIIAFDRGGKFEPGNYTLSRIPPSRKGDTSRDTHKKRPRGKKRRKYHVMTGIRPIVGTSH